MTTLLIDYYYIDLIGNSLCDPLDVSKCIIINNSRLLHELTETHIEQVVQCMVKMGKFEEGERRRERSSRLNLFTEWSPIGAKKCLEFLQAAVLVYGMCLYTHNSFYM